ncbi:MAG: glycoside hydrolase [Acidobacteria bacterium]|nr:glycoside hydrolase [Acidobacteriota bacterium]
MTRPSAPLAVLLLFAIVLLAACASAPRPAGPAAPPAGAPPPPVADRESGEIPDSKPIVTYKPATSPFEKAGGGTNVRANQDASGRNQNETTIAINPTNPDNFVGGANDARLGSWTAAFYTTTDGGQTWIDGISPYRKHANQGDPTAAFCGDGTVVFGYLDYVGAYQPVRLVVAKSTDGGLSWPQSGVVAESQGTPFIDKPYIACAPNGTGAYANRVYMSWTNFGATTSPIRVAYSTDRGVTWTGAKNVSGSGGVQGSVPVAGRGGVVYVFWGGPSGIEFAKSTSGGASWSGWQTVSSVTGIGDDTWFRRNSFPTAAIDTSRTATDGFVYVAWADSRNGDADILLSRSTDGGTTWSPPLRVNDDPVGNGRDQFFPWMAVDGEGKVHLMWHDRREDAADDLFHVFVATSRDGGVTFDRNVKVTDVASRSSLTNFLGDYSAIAAGGGKIVPLWSDLRAGTGEEDAFVEVEPAFDYDTVQGLVFAGKTQLGFDDQEPRLGTGIVYDAISGLVSDLAAPDAWTRASCLAENLDAPPLAVPGLPPAGDALWILLRAEGPRGTGSYGSGSEHPDPRDPFDANPICD